jgi:hypothetical protein
MQSGDALLGKIKTLSSLSDTVLRKGYDLLLWTTIQGKHRQTEGHPCPNQAV